MTLRHQSRAHTYSPPGWCQLPSAVSSSRLLGLVARALGRVLFARRLLPQAQTVFEPMRVLEPVGRTPKSVPLADGSRSHVLDILFESRSYELSDV